MHLEKIPLSNEANRIGKLKCNYKNPTAGFNFSGLRLRIDLVKWIVG